MHFRQRPADYSDIAEITLMNPGDRESGRRPDHGLFRLCGEWWKGQKRFRF
jgi:hypothetical protein